VTNIDKRMEKLQVSFSILYESWANVTSFDILLDDESLKSLPADRRDLFRKKATAVLHKREMVWIAGAELNALCDHVVGLNRPAIPYSLSSLLTLKIESFLMMARSLLDVLSTAIAIHQLGDHNVQSFNQLRKRGDCPAWLKGYAHAEMMKSPALPLRKIGWLSFLLTEDRGEKCLRDFVTHRGIARYHLRELMFAEGWDLVLQPLPADNYTLPVTGVVEKILSGLSGLAALIDREFALKPPS
jgi:hypothetical protein